MTDAGGQQVGTTVKYLPFGGTRSGSVPTDKLFTGQRLDSTGLYYYGARYYDPSIGRFISPDHTIPDFKNPQSYNRYSYCTSNPMKYIDPNGLDYLLVGGSGSTEKQMIKWKQQIVDSGVLTQGEQVYTLWDNDPENLLTENADINPRLDQLDAWLSNPTDANGNSVTVTDLKIVGHSEGAATVGTYIGDWIKGSDKVSASSSSLLNDQLSGVFLVDCPTGISNIKVNNFDYRDLNKVGNELQKRGIKSADIYNGCGIVHSSSLSGWKSYDVSKWYDYLAGPVAWWYTHDRAKNDSISIIDKVLNK
jgi:RHS repeat-associated protein